MGSDERITPTVLLVEDEEAIHAPLAELFEAEGYLVEIAHDLTTARRCLSLGAIDIVVLDMRLANGEFGGDFVVELADAEDAPAVVILSASPELAVPVARAYGVPWHPKPFDFDALVKTVRIAFDLDFYPIRASERAAAGADRASSRRPRRRTT